jgi:hypothetical protein
MRVLFVYRLEGDKLAAASIPLETARILTSAKETWVVDHTPAGTDRYLVYTPEHLWILEDTESSEMIGEVLSSLKLSGSPMQLADSPVLPGTPGEGLDGLLRALKGQKS